MSRFTALQSSRETRLSSSTLARSLTRSLYALLAAKRNTTYKSSTHQKISSVSFGYPHVYTTHIQLSAGWQRTE